MSSDGPINADSYEDGADGSNTWDVSGGTGGTEIIIGPGDTNTLKCKFNAGDFSMGDALFLEVSFDAVTSTDMGGPLPTIKHLKSSLAPSVDGADGATISSRTYVYLLDMPSSVDAELAWEIDLVFTANGAGGEQTSIAISNVNVVASNNEESSSSSSSSPSSASSASSSSSSVNSSSSSSPSSSSSSSSSSSFLQRANVAGIRTGGRLSGGGLMSGGML